MRQLIRLAVVLGMLATTLLAGAAAGRADVVNPSLGNERAGITVIVHGPGGSRGGGGAPRCTWRMNTLDDFYNWTHLGSPIIIPPKRDVSPPPPVVPWSYAPLAGGPMPGTWFLSFCGNDGANFHWVMLDGSAPPVDIDAMLETALDYLEPPKPRIGVSPEDDLVVNVATWLWVDRATWDAQPSVTVSAGDGVPQIRQQATVRATAQSLKFTMGDGGSTPSNCEGPGTRWTTAYPADARSPSHCDYLYQRAANRYTITASIVWKIEWSAQGAAVNHGFIPLGTITTSSTVSRRVVEVQTIN